MEILFNDLYIRISLAYVCLCGGWTTYVCIPFFVSRHRSSPFSTPRTTFPCINIFLSLFYPAKWAMGVCESHPFMRPANFLPLNWKRMSQSIEMAAANGEVCTASVFARSAIVSVVLLGLFWPPQFICAVIMLIKCNKSPLQYIVASLVTNYNMFSLVLLLFVW